LADFLAIRVREVVHGTAKQVGGSTDHATRLAQKLAIAVSVVIPIPKRRWSLLYQGKNSRSITKT